MIKINNLVKKFKKIMAVNQVNLELDKSEILGLIGPNGAGKTTLVKLVAGLILPTSGEIYIDEVKISVKKRKFPVKIGLISSDERSFYWRVSGYENLRFFARISGLPARGLNRLIKQVLAEVELPPGAGDQKVMDYSAGMKKKLNFARALMINPDIYLMDEPTTAIDPHSCKKIQSLINNISHQNKTIIITSHNMNEIETLCTRIAFLNKGRIIKQGTPSEFIELEKKSFIYIETREADNSEFIRYIKTLPKIIFAESIPDSNYIRICTTEQSPVLNAVIRFINSQNIDINDLSVQHASLEDIFMLLLDK